MLGCVGLFFLTSTSLRAETTCGPEDLSNPIQYSPKWGIPVQTSGYHRPHPIPDCIFKISSVDRAFDIEVDRWSQVRINGALLGRDRVTTALRNMMKKNSDGSDPLMTLKEKSYEIMYQGQPIYVNGETLTRTLPSRGYKYMKMIMAKISQQGNQRVYCNVILHELDHVLAGVFNTSWPSNDPRITDLGHPNGVFGNTTGYDIHGNATNDSSLNNGGIPSYQPVCIDDVLPTPTPTPPVFSMEYWGLPTDKPLIGKFFSADKEDIGVFRPSTGIFYLKKVGSDISPKYIHFGYGSDLPMVGDFLGTGLSQLAVFRPSEGNWYIIDPMTLKDTSAHWGMLGDIPIPGKFVKGSNKLNLAVYRPSNGTIYILKENELYQAIKYGSAEDKPVVGDFQGLGYDQIALFRKSTGQWFVYNPYVDREVAVRSWGLPTDVPMAGKFTNGTSHDLVAYRESDGMYHSLNLSGATSHFQWGMVGDVPLAGNLKRAPGSTQDNHVVFRKGIWFIKN